MKILIVCSYNAAKISPFIREQVDSLGQLGVGFDYFKIRGTGAGGYLQNLGRLRQTVSTGNYDLVHAHYGLSGLLANLQRSVPVLTTYHGSDIHWPQNNVLSSLAGRLSTWNIYVYEELYDKLYLKPQNYSIIPCGINMNEMIRIPRKEARNRLGMNHQKKYILFSSSFERPVKNSKLAKEALNNVGEETKLVELKGYTRKEVVLLMNACDVLLLTSFTEGSPQVIKEAMACGLPIVATDVGEISQIIAGTDGCYLTPFNAEKTAQKLRQALRFSGKTQGRKKIEKYDNRLIAKKIHTLYKMNR